VGGSSTAETLWGHISATPMLNPMAAISDSAIADTENGLVRLVSG
jgi:hypothetical protein